MKRSGPEWVQPASPRQPPWRRGWFWEGVALTLMLASFAVAFAAHLERRSAEARVAALGEELQRGEAALFGLRQRRLADGEAIRAEIAAAETADWRPQGLADGSMLEISLKARRLRLIRSGETLFEAPVAIGKGWRDLGGRRKNFGTPTGQREILKKEEDPVWVPPDWHYQELAQKRGLKVKRLTPGSPLTLPDGRTLRVSGAAVLLRSQEGEERPWPRGKDILLGGWVVIPPIGTAPREKHGPLGTRRLQLGQGYAIHGTDLEHTVGTASSHGCLRMKNADIEAIYPMVSVGTRVVIE